MILPVALLCGVLVAWALGARLSRIADVRFRGDWLVLGAFAIQLAIFTALQRHVPGAYHTPLHVLTYVMVIAFLALNVRVPGFWLVTFGVACNVLVIFANNGRMPVTLTAWKATGQSPSLITATGEYNNNVLAGHGTHLAFLGDIFALPGNVPLANALSIGDVLIVIGMAAFVYLSCTPRLASSGWSALAPLRVPAFRRVLAGRSTSRLGDWVTMTAVVTWVFQLTHSTTMVSVFLVARIVAAIAGGIASAPLLDRIARFRALSLIEIARGTTTLAMVPFALGGHVYPVIALVCVSSFLGAATNPSASSLVPEVVPGEMLQAGNALHGVARNCTTVVGAVVGGASVSLFGIGPALAIDFATFAVAALLYARFPHAPPPVQDEQGAAAGRLELLKVLVANRVVFGLVSSFTIATAAMGLLNASLPRFFDVRIGDDSAYGYAIAALGAGLLCGEALTAFIRRESVARRSVGLAFLACAGALFIMSHTYVGATAFLMLFLVGAADGTTEVVYDTLIQLNVARRVQAGVFAVSGSVQNAGMVVGLLAAPVLAHRAAGAAPRVAAVALAASGLVAALTLIRRVPAHADSLQPAVDVPAESRAALNEVVGPVALGRDVELGELLAGRVAVVIVVEPDYDVPSEGWQELVQGLDAGAPEHGAAVAWTRPTAEVTRALGEAVHGGIYVIDSQRVLRFAYAASEAGEAIPASFVLSRLSRLAHAVPPDPVVQVVRTTPTPGLVAGD